LTATELVLWLILTQLGAWANLLLGMRISGYASILAACAAAIFVYAVKQRTARRFAEWALVQALAVAIVLGSIGIAGLIFDASYDGQAYHQEAILQIGAGWNPIRHPDDAFATSTLYTPNSNETWIEHYPKGTWLESASIVAATGRIETGKAVNWVLLAASFLLAYVAAQMMLPRRRWLALLVAAVAALNPISITQAFTFYVDGQMGSLVLILLAAAVIAWKTPDLWFVGVVAVACSAMQMATIKFTGVPLAMLLLAGVAPLLWRGAPSRRVAVWAALCLVVAFGFSLVALGYNPYVTNLRAHGSPFYPAAGQKRIDLLTIGAPKSFLARGSTEKLAISLFARSTQSSLVLPVLKMPGLVTRDEIKAFAIDGYDVGYAGFGPLFSVVLVFAALVALLLAWDTASSSRSLADWPLAAWLGATLLVSVFINTGAWWARLAPQIWILALFPLVLGVAMAPGARVGVRRAVLLFATLGLAAALANSGLVAAATLWANLTTSRTLEVQLAAMRDAPSGSLDIDTMGLSSTARRLHEARVRYREVRLDGDDVPMLTGTFARVVQHARDGSSDF